MAESDKALGLRHQRRQYPSTAHSGQRLNTNAIEITKTVRSPLFFPVELSLGDGDRGDCFSKRPKGLHLRGIFLAQARPTFFLGLYQMLPLLIFFKFM